MDEHILSYITWKYLKPINGLTEEKTFEYLCADFVRIHCPLESLPIPSGNPNYPGIEGQPVLKKDDGKFYQFQAKYGEDAFKKNEGFQESCEKINSAIKNGQYKLDTVYFFSKKSFLKEKESKEAYLSRINIAGVKIIDFFGDNFIAELKKKPYWGLILRYFYTDKIAEEIYDNYETLDKTDTRFITKMPNVENGFDGDRHFYLSDLKIASVYQERYTIKKLGYSNMSYVLEKYDELEKDVASETFLVLGLSTYKNLYDFLDRAIKTLDGDNVLKKKYHTELESLIPHKNCLFINYGTEEKSILRYEGEEQVIFKDKR